MAIISNQCADINAGIERYKITEGAVLLDVRSLPEYQQQHIPGSVNLPLNSIGQAPMIFSNLDTPLFVFCTAGVRAEAACAQLREMGYTKVDNIGGIMGYTGPWA